MEDNNLDGFRALHTNNWEDIWNNGNIELETDDLELQKVILLLCIYSFITMPIAVRKRWIIYSLQHICVRLPIILLVVKGCYFRLSLVVSTISTVTCLP